MPNVKGIWVWQSSFDTTGVSVTQEIEGGFISNGKTFHTINIISNKGYYYEDENLTRYESDLYYDDVLAGLGGFAIPYTINVDEAYREMDFGTTEQEVSEEFYNFLIEHATYQSAIAKKLTQIAENEQRVYDAGKAEGYQKGYDEGNADGVEEGKKSEYDLFWDTFQKNGTRQYYERAFADTVSSGRMWVYGKNYKPKYPMKPLNARQMYEYGYLPYEAIAAVDFSECKDFYNTFAHFSISNEDRRFPPIDLSKATITHNMFGWVPGIRHIEKVLISETTPLQTAFSTINNLIKIRFEGTIAATNISFAEAFMLSKSSIENIFNCLSATVSGKTLTLSKTAVDAAFTTAEWEDLINTKPNWKIALV